MPQNSVYTTCRVTIFSIIPTIWASPLPRTINCAFHLHSSKKGYCVANGLCVHCNDDSERSLHILVLAACRQRVWEPRPSRISNTLYCRFKQVQAQYKGRFIFPLKNIHLFLILEPFHQDHERNTANTFIITSLFFFNNSFLTNTMTITKTCY